MTTATTASYNKLVGHSRSAATHPALPLGVGGEAGDGSAGLLSLYSTGHLTLKKIKAFRHTQFLVHLAQRELARDVSLVERWVRLVLIGR
ncbi:hypothetical protein KEM52_000835, partial [Ascosphaera acerosa]